jgi:hypothetical protein
MAISVGRRPGPIAWSRCPTKYFFSYTLQTPGDKLQAQFLWLEGGVNIPSSAELANIAYPITAINGGVTMNEIHELIDPFLMFDMPGNFQLGSDAKNPQRRETAYAVVQLRYRAWNPTSAPGYTTYDTNLYMVKGGWSRMAYDLDVQQNDQSNFSSGNFFRAGKQYLTSVPSGRMMTPEEWGWILFLSGTDNAMLVVYNVTYLDGSTGSISRALTGLSGSFFSQSWFLPLGVAQAELDPDNKGVKKYTIAVIDDTVEATERMSYVVNIDQRPYYNSLVLYYRNSMGGIDHIRLRGVTETTADVEKQEYRQFRKTDSNNEGGNAYYKSLLRYSYKGSTGYISKAHAQSLAELYNSTAAWVLHKGEWMNMRIKPQKMTPIASEDMLYSCEVEFETANQFELVAQDALELDTYNPAEPA